MNTSTLIILIFLVTIIVSGVIWGLTLILDERLILNKRKERKEKRLEKK